MLSSSDPGAWIPLGGCRGKRWALVLQHSLAKRVALGVAKRTDGDAIGGLGVALHVQACKTNNVSAKTISYDAVNACLKL